MSRTTKLSLALALAAALPLAACKGEKQETVSSTQTTTVASTTEAPAAPVTPVETTSSMTPEAIQTSTSAQASSPSGKTALKVEMQDQKQPASSPAARPQGTISMQSAIDSVPRISIDQLKEDMDKGGVVVIDVRGLAYYDGHIKGALNIPEAQLPLNIAKLPRDKKIVTYCSCPHEETSGRAVFQLQQAGFKNVAALEGGIGAWERVGFPVEKGEK